MTETSPKKTAMTKKEYNQRFYAKHKERLINEACEKTQCDLCNRTISKKSLISHKKTKLCHNVQIKNNNNKWLEKYNEWLELQTKEEA